jgi:hypothetical protein
MKLSDLPVELAPVPLNRRLYRMAWSPFEALFSLIPAAGGALIAGFVTAGFMLLLLLIALGVTERLTLDLTLGLTLVALIAGPCIAAILMLAHLLRSLLSR